jgi:Calcineurin-like phosphoesterase
MKINIKMAVLMTLIFAFSGCSMGVDFFGFFSSESNPDERFSERSSLPYHSDAYRLDPAILQSAPASYSFAVISDVHIDGSDDSSLNSFIQKEIAPSSANNDLFMLDCGDSTQSGTEEQIQNYKDSMDSSGIPWFQSIGNHDLYFEGWKNYRAVMGRTVYTFSVGNKGASGSLLAISLDSGNSTLGSKQMEWLESTLATEAGNWDHIVIFTHSNFFSTGLNTVVQFSSPEEIYKLMNLFSRYGVDIVFTGHNHHWDSREVNGVRYIIMEPLVQKDTSYVRVWVNTGNINYEKVRIQTD